MTITAPASDAVLQALRQALGRKTGSAGKHAITIGDNSNLLDVGVVDSQGLLDLILEVEESCGLMFDPSRIDLESGITLGTLAHAFA